MVAQTHGRHQIIFLIKMLLASTGRIKKKERNQVKIIVKIINQQLKQQDVQQETQIIFIRVIF